jgi:hypothetical protein
MRKLLLLGLVLILFSIAVPVGARVFEGNSGSFPIGCHPEGGVVVCTTPTPLPTSTPTPVETLTRPYCKSGGAIVPCKKPTPVFVAPELTYEENQSIGGE